MTKKLLFLLVLLLTATTGAWAQEPTTYSVKLNDGTEDADKWTISPTEAAAGTTITATYSGTRKVKSVKAVKKAAGDAYLKWNADQKKLVATEFPAEVTTVENADGDVDWAAGTYVVEGDVIINASITLNGAVDLIIKDGAKLTVNSYINGGSSKYNLSIYGQANQTGQLVVNCSSNNDAIYSITTLEIHSCQVKATSSYSSSYRSGFYSIGTFNVYGGSVDAEYTGSSSGNGIGLNNSGSMNIHGGDVKAVGKGTGNGIYGPKSTVTVYGGKLWAENVTDGKKALNGNATLAKGTGFTGKIETSSDGSSWTEYTTTGTPGTKYVRVGY